MRLKYGEGIIRADYKPPRRFVEWPTTHIATLQKPADIINQALDKPIGCHPFNEVFRGARNVLIVVPNSHEVEGAEYFLPIILARLKKLHAPENEIRLLVAKTDDREAQKISFPHLGFAPAQIFRHDPFDHKALAYVGLTRRRTPVFVNRLLLDADHVLLCGSAGHHPFAGYRGGPQLIVPGCAGHETAARHFSHALDPEAPRVQARCRDGLIEGNPLQEDAREAFRFITTNFLLNTLWNDRRQMIGAVAGEPLQAFAAACRAVDDMFQVAIPPRAPSSSFAGEAGANLVIASCGGFSYDADFHAAHTALLHAAHMTRPGGVIIFVAQCRDGLGSVALASWLQEACGDEEALDSVSRSMVQRRFQKQPGDELIALSTLELAREFRIIMVSELDDEQVRRLGFVPAETLQEALKFAEPFLQDSYSAFLIPNGSLLVPRF